MGVTFAGHTVLMDAGSCLGCCDGSGRDACCGRRQMGAEAGGGGGAGFVTSLETVWAIWLEGSDCGRGVTRGHGKGNCQMRCFDTCSARPISVMLSLAPTTFRFYNRGHCSITEEIKELYIQIIKFYNVFLLQYGK